MKHVIGVRFQLPKKYSKKTVQKEIQSFLDVQYKVAKNHNDYIDANPGFTKNYLPYIHLIDMEIVDNPIIMAISGNPDIILHFSVQFQKKSHERDALHELKDSMKDWREGKPFNVPTSYENILYTNYLHETSDKIRKHLEKTGITYTTTTYYVL